MASSSDNENESVFEYEFTIPESTAIIRIMKADIVEIIEKRVGRTLSEEEGSKVWSTIKTTNTWHEVFPSYAAERGIHMYGSSDSQLYNEIFKADVEACIQESVDNVFAELGDNLLERAFDEVMDELADELETKTQVDEITWDNIESHTQTRIQDENVKNGLARCANELKKTSIKKWRAHYVNTHIINSTAVLPHGKNRDEVVNHIISYLT